MQLTEPLLALLRAPSIGYLATIMPDGSPQIDQVRVILTIEARTISRTR